MFTWEFEIDPPVDIDAGFTWEFLVETTPDDFFEWEFHVSDIVVDSRHCHRGPMIALEKIIAVPFVRLASYDFLREALYNVIVSTENPAVRTREILLRVINSSLVSLFPKLYPQKKTLPVTICEKRESFDIYLDVAHLKLEYINAVLSLEKVKIPQNQLSVIVDAMGSKDIMLRVASLCAAVVLMAYIEMELG